MKPNKKSYILIFILYIFTFGFIGNISAASHGYKDSLLDSCVNDNTCLMLCGYENKVRYTYAHVNPPGYNYFSAYIYYHFDGKWQITWYSQETDAKMARHTKTSNNSIPTDNIFWKSDLANKLLNKGECPSTAYIDTDTMGWASELCFDNADGKYCVDSDPGGAGTKFERESTKKYDYAEHIKIYFDQHAPTIPSCEALRTQQFNIEETLNTDFKKNFLFNNAVPSFINANPAYLLEMDTLKSKYADIKTDCDKKAKEELDEGTITEEEYNTIIEENQNGLDEAIDQVNTTQSNFVRPPDEGPDVDIDITEGCGLISQELEDWINGLLNIIKIGAIAVTVILTMLDFAKAAALGEAETMKKTWSKLIKRLVIVLILFILPIVIDFILGIISINGVDPNNPTCGIK